MRIGLISDTHGLLRPEAMEALRGSDLILHAGDVGSPAIVDQLQAIAPVRVVRGNCDHEPWADRWPLQLDVNAGGVRIRLLHDLSRMRGTFEGLRAVVYGHSHRPEQRQSDGVLHVNPGSAGPKRFRLPISVGVLQVEGGVARAELVLLNVESGQGSE